MPTESALNRRRSAISRARAGDRAAFDELYEQAVTAVWQAAAAGWSWRAEAEALTATILAEAFGALPELPDQLDFSAYCLRVLARVSAQTAADASVPAES